MASPARGSKGDQPTEPSIEALFEKLQKHLNAPSPDVASLLLLREIMYQKPNLMPDSPTWYPSELLAKAIAADGDAQARALKELAKSTPVHQAALASYQMNIAKQPVKALDIYKSQSTHDQAWAWRGFGLCLQQGLAHLAPDDEAAADAFRKAADLGDARAMVNLARCYETGQGIAQHSGRALGWLDKAARLHYPPGMVKLASMHRTGQGGTVVDYDKALKLYKQAAKKGLPQAQCSFGYMLQHGLGTAVDTAGAIQHYTNAAEQGLAEAHFNLGVCCELGLYVPVDPTKAYEYYTAAAKAGSYLAANNLGLCLEHGSGCEQSLPLALLQYEKAMADGCVEAAFNAAHIVLTKMTARDDVVIPPQQLSDAVKHLKYAADKGHVQSQFTLGLCYEKGQPVGLIEADIWQALELFQSAADKGHPEAQSRVGYSYLHGDGLPENNDHAVKLFKASAKQFHPAGQNNLAVCYYSGFGVKKNYKAAIELFILAAQAGNLAATCNLSMCKFKGHGVDKDATEALELQQLAGKVTSDPHDGVVL
eukprot:TRINITY_DN1283_c0_g1_i1.p1 TRINITY_DN1283_c0_g1~~TRINITY_DN1283_c0_g1_i1.p1  ORF type:complete len:537 (+),score=110.74 TRINITY_DN1283_c0_g1_i1:98-1708(+)